MPSEGEKKCKGWSDEGMVAFEKRAKVVKKDEEDSKHVAWDEARWDVTVEKLGHAQSEQDEPLRAARCKPNLDVVCEGFQRFNVAVRNVKCQVSVSQTDKRSSSR